MPSLTKLFSNLDPCTEAEARQCKHCIGFFNFLSKVARFDISHATAMLSTQMQNPTLLLEYLMFNA